MIMPIGQTIVAQAAGPRRMGRVMSIIGVPMLLGPVLGPVLGGLIVDSVSWRWIFFVNLPIGALALVLAARLLPPSKPGHGQRLDLRGLVLLSPGLALLVYGLSRAGSQGGFGSARTLTPLVVGAVLVAAFARLAPRRGGWALIDLRLFAKRDFSAAAATGFLFGVGLFGAMLLLPLYYQVVRGDSALEAGLLMTPQGIGAAMAMPMAGRLTDRIGAGRVVPVGLLLALLGTAAYTQVGPHTSNAFLATSLWVRGLGLGATMMPAMAAAYATLERAAVPRATSALNIIQRVGGSVGTALLAVFLQRRIEAHVPVQGAGLGAIGQIPSNARAEMAAPLAAAFGDTFWLAFGLMAIAMLPALLLPRVGPQRQDEEREAAAAAADARERAPAPRPRDDTRRPVPRR